MKKLNLWRCHFCGLVLNSNESLKNHLETHEKINLEKPKIAKKCEICENGSVLYTDLDEHIKKGFINFTPISKKSSLY